jgi:predicted ester cyclase
MGRPRDSAERFSERFGAGDFDGAVGLFSHTRQVGGAAGRECLEGVRRGVQERPSDARMEIVSVVEAGDAVAVEARFKGTHKDALAIPQGEIPASGNAIDVPFADFFRLGDDRFIEHRVYGDQAAMMAQLSPAPPPS